jgi:SAM-dependent methyltransferase
VALAPLVARIEAIDISGAAVEQARRRAEQLGIRNVTFRAVPFQHFSMPDESVDLVYALGLVHHLPDPHLRGQLFRAARQCLVPGGWLYTRDPSSNGLPRRLAYRFFRDRCGIHSPNESHLCPRVIRQEVEAAGFTESRIDYTDVLGGPLPWLVGSPSALLWRSVFAFDRAWLAIPGLRRLASQFALTARAPRTAGVRHDQ